MPRVKDNPIENKLWKRSGTRGELVSVNEMKLDEK